MGVITVIQYKKMLIEKLKNLPIEGRIDVCYQMACLRSNTMACRRAAISLFGFYLELNRSRK